MHGLPLPAPETSRSIYISEGAMQMSEKKALTLAPDIQEWLAMASELPWHAVAQVVMLAAADGHQRVPPGEGERRPGKVHESGSVGLCAVAEGAGSIQAANVRV